MKATEKKYNTTKVKSSTLLLLMFGEKRAYCYWCGQKLHNCEKCKGKGRYNQHQCELCGGTGVLCSTHDKLWD